MKEKQTKGRKWIWVGVVAVVAAAALLGVLLFGESPFDGIVSDMLKAYPFADNARAQDGSYLKIDTNPYDKDVDDMTYVELSNFEKVQEDSMDAIRFVNGELGFTDALYSKMMDTTALMGRQSEENDKYRVSWSYHPDSGLEVMYEKK